MPQTAHDRASRLLGARADHLLLVGDRVDVPVQALDQIMDLPHVATGNPADAAKKRVERVQDLSDRTQRRRRGAEDKILQAEGAVRRDACGHGFLFRMEWTGSGSAAPVYTASVRLSRVFG